MRWIDPRMKVTGVSIWKRKRKIRKLNDDDLFTIVGADYQIHTPVLKNQIYGID